MDSNGLLWVLIVHYASFRILIGPYVFMGPYESLWALWFLIGFYASYGCLWVVIGLYESSCVLMGPFRSLCVLMCT